MWGMVRGGLDWTLGGTGQGSTCKNAGLEYCSFAYDCSPTAQLACPDLHEPQSKEWGRNVCAKHVCCLRTGGSMVLFGLAFGVRLVLHPFDI